MSHFIDLIVNLWTSLLLLLHGVHFNLYGFDVDLLSVILAFFVIFFVLSLFWKGAKA